MNTNDALSAIQIKVGVPEVGTVGVAALSVEGYVVPPIGNLAGNLSPRSPGSHPLPRFGATHARSRYCPVNSCSLNTGIELMSGDWLLECPWLRSGN